MASSCNRNQNSEGKINNVRKTIVVQAKKRIYHDDGTRTYTDWVDFKTRSLQQLTAYEAPKNPVRKSKWGGRRDVKVESTGFFHVRKIDERWWGVDPEGYLFMHVAVNSINRGKSERNKEAFAKKFGTSEKWINETNKMIHDHGYNGAGSWSDTKSIISSKQQAKSPLAYTVNLNFMSGYGKERGGTYAVPGHTGYPNSTIFVFDEGFKRYCEKVASELISYKDDPNLYGYFSDNELPFKQKTLDGYLSLDNPSDPGYISAQTWLIDHNIKAEKITDESRNNFLAYVADEYFRIVTNAIKKYDPNHIFLGPRLYSSEKNIESFMITAGKYVDVLSCNYYGRWTPVPEEINNWTSWSGKPFIITEWYVKGEDSGLPNISGAGWIVKTQTDRGLFYQNYTLALLESGNCIGWHWFKYQDNDPSLEGAELSNIDANKGIVNFNYDGYKSCLDKMSEINNQMYDLIDYFDRQK